MHYFSNDQMKHARKANLYDYLLQNHRTQVIREGKSIRLIGNRSVSIKCGYSGYMDFATGDKGNSVDFLIKYMGYALDEAVFSLCGESCAADKTPLSLPEVVTREKCQPIFPMPAEGCYRQLFAFLTGRGIPDVIIQSLVDQQLLYQSREMNNAVFINKERDWAELRGTCTWAKKQFHGIAPNCRSDGFWWFRTNTAAEIAYVCEAAIDAISLFILHQRNGMTTPAYYISIGGAAKQPAIDRIKRQRRTILAVDRDDAGQKCREKNCELEYILPCQNDWNEDLMNGCYYGGKG